MHPIIFIGFTIGIVLQAIHMAGQQRPQYPLFNATTPWRVSPENPASTEGFDYERCAHLHNELLEMGWVGSGKTLESLHENSKTWFEKYGEEAESMLDRLSDELVGFLERALVVDDHSLFYYVGGLAHPLFLWWLQEHMVRGEEDQFLTLYMANQLASHADGLVLDQVENRAIIKLSIIDSRIAHNGRIQWYPLEVVLSAWLDMVESGKIQAVPDNDIDDRFMPWVCHPWSEQGLCETLDVYNQLVDAIESRMPNQPPPSSPSEPERLLSEGDLDAANIPPGLARSFLTKARRPRFRYIAPGLSVPSSTSFPQPPFSTSEYDGDENEDTIQPILLFHASSSSYSTVRFPFTYPYSRVSTHLSGLYFTTTFRASSQEFEDGVKLILPFGIGKNGYARTSDGARFGENKEDWGVVVEAGDRTGELYQPGYQPFTEMHEVTLVKVLRNWVGMVERGDWKVGSEGVVGGIETFREADTPGSWEKYVVPVGW